MVFNNCVFKESVPMHQQRPSTRNGYIAIGHQTAETGSSYTFEHVVIIIEISIANVGFRSLQGLRMFPRRLKQRPTTGNGRENRK